MPLQNEPFDNNVCHAFFSGYLPEAQQRVLIAKILGTSAYNDFSMLEKIGGECAGAISFLPTGLNPSQIKNTYKELTPDKLSEY